MSTRIILDTDTWTQLRTHVVRPGGEHLAFLLANTTYGNGYTAQLVRDVIPVADSELLPGYILRPSTEALLRVMNEATRRGMHLIEVHNHPLADLHVQFSSIDLEGQAEITDYLRDAAPGLPYGALVLGERSVDGLLWLPSAARPKPVSEVRVIGSSIARFFCNSVPRQTPTECSLAQLDRQIRALGLAGQKLLAGSTVAIVGAGGIGSAIAQQLAHLHVGRILLIDDDRIESTNLHRLIGATQADIGQPKAEVLARFVQSICPTSEIHSVVANVRARDVVRLLKEVDVVVGCVDTDSGRMVMNEVSLAHLVPWVDCGVGIEVRDGAISTAGGKVSVWTPGRPCALCCRDFDPRIAAEELESREEREFRRRHGYVAGAHVPEPAIVSLNGTVASLATTEVLALLTAFRASNHYTYYDLLEHRVGPRIVGRIPGCPACGIEGLGDNADVERYGREGLPQDLPDLAGARSTAS